MDKCALCRSSEKDLLRFGEFLQGHNIGVHLFCLYLTNDLLQRGEDNEGFYGFFIKDIKKAVKQISKMKCVYCNKTYANIKCSWKPCGRKFHFGCGLKYNAQNHFIGKYQSFCHYHGHKVRKPPKDEEICSICYDNLIPPNETFNKVTMLNPSCCRNGWFHKYCLQNFANHSGYYFKCPLCNNEKIFRVYLSRRGIFIPEKDASWELEPHAFEDLLERPNQCVVKNCNNINKTDFVYCRTCGSVAIHTECLPNKFSNFQCDACLEIVPNSSFLINSDEDEDVDIDVCSVTSNTLTANEDSQTYQKKMLEEIYSTCDSDEQIPTVRFRRKNYRIIDDSSSEDSSEDESAQTISNNNRINISAKAVQKQTEALDYTSSDSSTSIKQSKTDCIKNNNNILRSQNHNIKSFSEEIIGQKDIPSIINLHSEEVSKSTEYELCDEINNKTSKNVGCNYDAMFEKNDEDNSDDDPLELFFLGQNSICKDKKDRNGNKYVLDRSKVLLHSEAATSTSSLTSTVPMVGNNFENSIDIHPNAEALKNVIQLNPIQTQKEAVQLKVDNYSENEPLGLDEPKVPGLHHNENCIAKRTRQRLRFDLIENRAGSVEHVIKSLNGKQQRYRNEFCNGFKLAEPRVKLRRLSIKTNSNIDILIKDYQTKRNNKEKGCLKGATEDVKSDVNIQDELQTNISCIANRTRRRSMFY